MPVVFRRAWLAASLAALTVTAVPAAAQAPDTAFARLVREYTTDQRFLPPSVASLPTSATIPSPQKHFGTIIGAPGVMHHAAEVYGYFAALAKATKRVHVDTIGTSEEGRAMILVTIADEATIAHLDRYRQATARLADPRTLPAAQLDGVLDHAKPIYYLNGGLHSTEMGSPEMLMELAYRLVASDAPAIKAIRDNVIVQINPVSDPDGRDEMVDWYYRYTKTRTDWDDGFPRSSPFWGKYVFHDDNRDGLQMSQAVSKATDAAYYKWHPTVMHDLHESIPLLYIMTGTGPYNATTDPTTIGEWHLFAQNDMTVLGAQNMPGLFTWAFFDGWWPGYLIWVAINHNSIGRFYETFGNAGANTYVRDLGGARFAGDSVTKRTWYRPDPSTRFLRWSARDNTNYMEAGVLASLDFTARNGRELLKNFWIKGTHSIERGETQAPYAFEVPALQRQRDPRRAAYLINQLERQHIEIHRRTQGDSAGDFVILMNQPYRDLAVTLLTKQDFPVNDPNAPYDDVAWTLGLLYGVKVKAIDDSSVFGWKGLQAVSDTVAYDGAASGNGSVGLVAYRAQAEVLPALYWLKSHASGAAAFAAEKDFTVGSDSFPRGSLVIEHLPSDAGNELARQFGLDVQRADKAPDVPRHALDLPRIGIYHTWFSTQDDGWARYTFEMAKIPYTSIDKDDLKAGKLRDRFDVILVPNAGGSAERWMHGIDSKWSPLAFTKTKQYPAHGVPFSSPDITGGPGFRGMAELQRFVDDGGTIITLANATRFVAETGIAEALSPYNARGLFHPGSIVTTKIRQPDSPILYGYPTVTHVFRGNGPLYQVNARDRDMMIMQYGTTKSAAEKADEAPRVGLGLPPAPAKSDSAKADSTKTKAHAPPYVLSGGVRNQRAIIGRGAIFSVPVGKGHVVAFTFDALHRYLNQHDFPMVYNAILNWDDLK